MFHRLGLRVSLRPLLVACFLLITGAAAAQPYNSWLANGSIETHGYAQLPASLNFAGGSFTFEAWIDVTGAGGCSSLAGNGYFQSTWIGICGTTLRSYLQGSGSLWDMGTVPANDWTHIAVTFDAATMTRSHYIDGELVGQHVDSGAIPSSATAWRIFSDASWPYSPSGEVDEVRFWNVARTRDQIRSTINQEIDAPRPGLVAVYEFDADASDAVGTFHGTKMGTATYSTSAVVIGCATSPSVLCLGPGGRFAVSTTWKTATSSGIGSTAALTTSESGIFTFFSPTNWESMVKVLNGCGVNGHWWVFAAGMTDQHVELVVTDLPSGTTKRYFNYAGTPYAPINDTTAFARCP